METCPICLDSIDGNITSTNCNHAFCDLCFDELMDNNKIECPLCRRIIKEYSRNGEKVRILVKTREISSTPTSEVINGNLNTRLITRTELRKYNMRNYIYSLLIIYICYLY
ncbi:MAG: hypothetical protein CL892_03895, partial [Dehalococcoidia bacterium]|nr:hypothetical protein [Dehalococcoidia bacterium]